MAAWSRAEEPSSPPSPSAFRVVVLHNGNAIAGQFEQSGDRITLTQGPGHTVRVPVSEVDFIVPRWRDAYRLLRKRLRTGEIDERLRLAQWCLRYDQVNEATDLLLEMSRLYPQHSAVRALEQQLARRAGVGNSSTHESKVQPVSFQTTEGQAVGSVESRLSIPLEGAPSHADMKPSAEDSQGPSALETLAKTMEPAAVTEFTRTIQPLLLNRCGMANCHAPAGRSSFKIQRIPLGKLTHRDLTWINLQSVLQRIDPKHPDESELLSKAVTPHGRSRRAPIDTHQVRQRERLEKWVFSVANDESSQEWTAAQFEQLPASPIPTPSAGLKALQEATGGTGTAAQASYEEFDEESSSSDEPSPDNKDAKTQDAPSSPASSDPLDPEHFNRKHHPKTP